MKNKTYVKRILILVFACYLPAMLILRAQITIGLDKPATKGALLQLKLNENTRNNSSKGLSLPRVNLTDKWNLYPMFEADGNNYKIEGVNYIKADEDEKHIGLWVYNINPCLNQIGSSEGPYVWDGSKWQNLRAEIPSNGAKEFRDSRDGESYTYQQFGEAGIWMTENLRTKRLPGSNTDIPLFDAQIDDENPSIAYPSPSSSQDPKPWKNPQYYNQNPKLGILYNWYAATNSTEATSIGNIDQAQATPLGSPIGAIEVENVGNSSDPSNPSVKFIQGICPDGWHLPSDREWNLLERYIYQNADKLSTYTSEEVLEWNTTTPWNSAWEVGLNENSFEWRGVPNNGTKGHGYAMMAPCSSSGTTRGKSNIYWQGGFCALLSGTVWSSHALHFGWGAAFWTSSSAYDSKPNILNAWYRMIYNDGQGVRVLRYQNTRELLFNVRCKKNNNEM